MQKRDTPFPSALLACSLCLLSAAAVQRAALAETATTPGATASASADQAPVATVNGKPISKQVLDVYEKLQASARPGQPTTEANLVDNLVGLQLLTEDALQKGLDKDPTVQAQLEFQRLNILASAALRELLHSRAITEEELKKEYDRVVEAAPQTEYKASHILTKTKEEAEDVIKQLDQGKAFADLAKEKSTDTSAKQGGDLGWFVPQQMVEPFGETVQKLEKGSYTKSPVETEYGWHVIKLEDVRTNEPPPFDSVKSQVESMLQNRMVNEYVNQLRKQAKVEVLTPIAPVPESAAPPSAETSANTAGPEGHASEQTK